MALLTLREQLRRYIPPWFSDRPESGKTAAFRLLYSWAAPLDAIVQGALEGLQARFPGVGTPTAFSYLGRDRRIFRGPLQPEEAFAVQLLAWLTYWRAAGNAWSIAASLADYMAPGAPRVRIVNRLGMWFTLHSDKTIEWHQSSPNNWDWDSLIDNNSGSSRWWECWVVIYAPPYETDAFWGDPGDWGDDGAFGTDSSTENTRTIVAMLRQFKGAHSGVTLIWSYDDTAFDPEAPIGDPGLPDGLWGQWWKVVGGVAVPSRREDCRYWEIT